MAKFRKVLLDKENKCEACSVFDVSGSGRKDIVCGEYVYEGPDFKKKRKICDITYEHEYVWDFSDYPMDTNGNGRLDIITGSWWGEGVFVRENPGDDGEWTTRKVCDSTNVETIKYFDIDNDGIDEIFPNCPNEPAYFLKLVTDENGKGTGEFKKYVIGEENADHGMGFGDIDGDGKVEIILKKGILHMPDEGPLSGKWEFVEEDYDMNFLVGVPIIVYDVNKDGTNDLIVGNGHGYGLFWYEQKIDENGKRTWEQHIVDGAWSQYHDMQIVDIDGEDVLLTGKRYSAHNGNDPGDNENVFVCYYTFRNGGMYRHIIDYGDPMDDGTGVGIYFWTDDLTGNGKLDIVAPGKEGLYVLYSE